MRTRIGPWRLHGRGTRGMRGGRRDTRRVWLTANRIGRRRAFHPNAGTRSVPVEPMRDRLSPPAMRRVPIGDGGAFREPPRRGPAVISTGQRALDQRGPSHVRATLARVVRHWRGGIGRALWPTAFQTGRCADRPFAAERSPLPGTAFRTRSQGSSIVRDPRSTGYGGGTTFPGVSRSSEAFGRRCRCFLAWDELPGRHYRHPGRGRAVQGGAAGVLAGGELPRGAVGVPGLG